MAKPRGTAAAIAATSVDQTSAPANDNRLLMG